MESKAETSVKTSATRQWQKHCNLTACNLTGRLRVVMSVGVWGRQRVETTVETAVMIQGWAHRKTMKRHCLIPWSFSKENKETTGKAMVSNGACSPDGGQGGPTIRSVAALLTYKLKNDETPPDNGYAAHSSGVGNVCSFCHGDGAVVLNVQESDPDYAGIDRASGKAIPCPYCS